MIQMFGIDYSTASVDVRSAFAIKKSEQSNIMNNLKDEFNLHGIVLLHTCNRTEVWVSGDADVKGVLAAFCELKNVSASQYENYFTIREADDAIEHLMWLTCGLKSAIIAEDQILTQIKQAIDFARYEKLSDSSLDVLFRMAVTAAKKIKTEVVFSRANLSAVDEAIELLSEDGFDINNKKCLVIGNGAYGCLAANTLIRGGADVTVTIRQYHSGEVMIPKGCKTILYGDRYNCFEQYDMIVSATASPNYTLTYDRLSKLNIDKDIILLDLAVPRDIEPRIKELCCYKMYNIDDFKTKQNDANEQAVSQAKKIIDEQIEEFRTWYNYRNTIPLIEGIKNSAVCDIEKRIDKDIRKLSIEKNDEEQLRNRVKDAAGKVVANIFYHMREVLDEEDFKKCVKAVWEYENE